MMMMLMMITRRKVTACLPGLARACALVPVVLQLASRRKAVCRSGWTSMARAASSWSRWSSGSERRVARATRPAWLHTPSWGGGGKIHTCIIKLCSGAGQSIFLGSQVMLFEKNFQTCFVNFHNCVVVFYTWVVIFYTRVILFHTWVVIFYTWVAKFHTWVVKRRRRSRLMPALPSEYQSLRTWNCHHHHHQNCVIDYGNDDNQHDHISSLSTWHPVMMVAR